MKKILFVLLTVVFLSAPAFSGVEFSEQYFEELAQSKNKIPEITVPAYERFELGKADAHMRHPNWPASRIL